MTELSQDPVTETPKPTQTKPKAKTKKAKTKTKRVKAKTPRRAAKRSPAKAKVKAKSAKSKQPSAKTRRLNKRRRGGHPVVPVSKRRVILSVCLAPDLVKSVKRYADKQVLPVSRGLEMVLRKGLKGLRAA